MTTPLPFVPLTLALAVVLGGAIGLERQWHGRPAGLRTHTLVCLTATMLILVSRAVAQEQLDLGEAGRVVFDPNRMGAGIVTGIGFLGAATVIRSADHLRGLTTAACIWFVAGLGIVLGTGHHAMAVGVTAVALVVLTLVSRFEAQLRPVLYRELSLVTTGRESDGTVTAVRGELASAGVRVLDLAASWNAETDRTELVFHVSLKDRTRQAVPPLIERLSRLERVMEARWRFIR